MSKFKVGQEVIFTKGDLVEVKGVVHTPFWQVSQSDWPEVIVEYGDGLSAFVDIDDVRPAEDPYEYAVRRVGRKPEMTYIVGDFWSDKEDRSSLLKSLTRDPAEGLNYKLVKRLKAGPEEDA